MDRLVIYGTGALARSLVLYNNRYKLYDIMGFIDDAINRESTFMGLPVWSYNDYVKITPPMSLISRTTKN